MPAAGVAVTLAAKNPTAMTVRIDGFLDFRPFIGPRPSPCIMQTNFDYTAMADVLLIGVSRTSKTPTSIYLANRGVKTANIPLVFGVPPPAGIEHLKRPLVVGLFATPRFLRPDTCLPDARPSLPNSFQSTSRPIMSCPRTRPTRAQPSST